VGHQISYELSFGFDLELHLDPALLQNAPLRQPSIDSLDVIILIHVVHLHLSQVVASALESSVHYLQVPIIAVFALLCLGSYSFLEL